MGPEDIARYALTLPEVTEEQPFGPDTDVYKVAGKVFAIVWPDAVSPRVNLKCDPTLALHLREQHAAVSPGYHMNKKHWNTVLLDGTVTDDEVEEMVEHSYGQVVAGLRLDLRKRIGWQR
ncbi:MmcQ/YjbR family DNA-binding protein [Acidothermaceae bacterium B102]|nr:MmcQ/YjbR family DNA-binding protein [Acidothermaceae bacterium B102]